MNSIVPGSVAAIANQQNKSLAEAFMDVKIVIIFDRSGSMNTSDTGEGRRFDVAVRHLTALQAKHPGEIALVEFSDGASFCPGGIPPEPTGMTNLARALKFSKTMDVPGVRFILISDGEPNNEQAAIDAARNIRAKIDVIYVGPEWDQAGREFLERLAKAAGGQAVTADRAKELSAQVERLLLTA